MWRTVEERSYHTSRIAYLISTDLILSELSDCEATQFAVAATNQNAVSSRGPRNPVTTVVTSQGQVAIERTCLGRNHGELSRFTATRFR